jgi:hypothetical protein
MVIQRDSASTPSARLEALKSKHQNLEKKIETKRLSPSVSDYEISKLKREKLLLKEQIEGIRQASNTKLCLRHHREGWIVFMSC